MTDQRMYDWLCSRPDSDFKKDEMIAIFAPNTPFAAVVWIQRNSDSDQWYGQLYFKDEMLSPGTHSYDIYNGAYDPKYVKDDAIELWETLCSVFKELRS